MSRFREHKFRDAAHAGPWSAPGRLLLTAFAMIATTTLLASAPWSREKPLRAPTLVVDANAVPEEVLSALPGVGPALAREISARRAEAPFVSLADLGRRARGVGPATLARLSRHLRAGAEVASLRDRP